MSWAVSDDIQRNRHIGYGVPAQCDHPECTENIDRGMAYACGGEWGAACGLFFCYPHRDHYDDNATDYVCERCANDQPPFEPSRDTLEWIRHVLSDESWAEWRGLNPEQVQAMQKQSEEAA